ncbi:DUF3263 domain-containing protein [Agromyces intestinalis]|uniref:DUF3263 domain-containing protein n=1 Tax=Agromyces intestinalis TaxID=2592652 RepID=A0A5C1YKJ2_9MICO|nr:DUF3263 domain-containing protein [Agromyces intestinalis]QEO15312.1 DUF3263 domain-containing protein [Agromyces intestinalis]
MHGAPRTEVDEPGTGRSEAPAGIALDERGRRILAFEHRVFRDEGAKAEAIRAEFELSAPRYYRILGELISSPDALRHDPMLVKRLLRLRDARRAARLARTPTLGRPLD